MSSNHDTIARDIFQERIKKGLLGPGSDIFVDENDKNEEIISDYPLQRYYTGVLFPEQIKKDTAESEVAQETWLFRSDHATRFGFSCHFKSAVILVIIIL